MIKQTIINSEHFTRQEAMRVATAINNGMMGLTLDIYEAYKNPSAEKQNAFRECLDIVAKDKEQYRKIQGLNFEGIINKNAHMFTFISLYEIKSSTNGTRAFRYIYITKTTIYTGYTQTVVGSSNHYMYMPFGIANNTKSTDMFFMNQYHPINLFKL